MPKTTNDPATHVHSHNECEESAVCPQHKTEDKVIMLSMRTDSTPLIAPHEFNFTPDWSERWTPQRAEQELNGFKFKGPGWYITKKASKKGSLVDTIFVLPGSEPDWFQFHVWNDRDARAAFSLCVGLPTHEEP